MWYERTEALIGKENIEKLRNSHVAVFGVGGVGSFAIEALVRAGIGRITIFDGDVVCESNINRQLIATTDVIGQPKVNIMAKRILSINPNIEIKAINEFYTPDNKDNLLKDNYTYVVDAIDSVPNKIDLIKSCYEQNIKIISSMGAANKINPAMFEVSDIYKTSVCPLAKVIRRKLNELNVKELKVVYSKEPPIKPVKEGVRLGSISFVPSSAGLLIASEVIRDIIEL